MMKFSERMSDIEKLKKDPNYALLWSRHGNWLLEHAEKVEIYVIMFTDEIFKGEFFTDEKEVQKVVERLNVSTNTDNYWYRTLRKGVCENG